MFTEGRLFEAAFVVGQAQYLEVKGKITFEATMLTTKSFQKDIQAATNFDVLPRLKCVGFLETPALRCEKFTGQGVGYSQAT